VKTSRNGPFMPTFTAFTTLAGLSQAKALGTAMENLNPAPYGVGVFEVEDGTGLREVGGYFQGPPDEAALAVLAAAFDARAFVVSKLPETDWVAHVRRELAPVIAGRFFLHGSHDAGTVPGGMVPLVIDAAMAFGTGHHGTTLGCLRALDQLASDGFACKSVADVGCGTAVLAMAAAKLWPDRPVLAGDIDPVAVQTARANVDINGLGGRVRCVECSGFKHDEMRASAPFDLVFANILKAPLIQLAPDMTKNVKTGGWIILSGILMHQAKEVLQIYANTGFDLTQRIDIGKWSTLTLRRSNV